MHNQAKVCRECVIDSLNANHLPKTEAAVRLICMVCAHESGGFTYTKQVIGPALGLLQMEPLTYKDVSGYALQKGYLKNLLPGPAERLIFDFYFAVAMARVFFLRIVEPLPNENDLKGLARYAKKYWNTVKGKATEDMYLNAYIKWFGD